MMETYPCPCCGYFTFSAPPPGTYQICPICFWEDACSLYEWGSNDLSLLQAQENFGKWGACQKDWVNDVRQPHANDRRLPNWKTLAESYETERLEVLRQIELAFEKVQLEDGISLLEARLIDDYEFACSRKKKDKNERLQQQKKHNCLFVGYHFLENISEYCLETLALKNWQDIPDKLIENLPDVLSFLDQKGFCFYIPAYMTWTLKFRKNSNSISSEFTIYALGGAKEYQQKMENFQAMNQAQSQAVCQFLRFIALYWENDAAIAYLEEYWGKFCEEKPGIVYYSYCCESTEVFKLRRKACGL